LKYLVHHIRVVKGGVEGEEKNVKVEGTGGGGKGTSIATLN